MKKCLVILLMLLIGFTSYGQEHKDCEDALVLCGESPFTIDVTEGIGMEDAGVSESCVVQKYTSTWIELKTVTSGDIIFEIIPAVDDDTDIDFIVFKLSSGDCDTKTIIRCMGSGEITGQNSESCLGPTGLAYGETDVEEGQGCNDGSNNFLAPIIAEEGDHYVLLVNNFFQTQPTFDLEVGGTAQLDCIVASNENELEDKVQPLFNVSQSTDQILINTNKLDGPAQLKIFDMTGTAVYQESVFENQVVAVDKTMPIGAYLVVLHTEQSTYTEKLMLLK